ncbi:MAG: hypothetical protein M3R55_11850 [Acidobacteriota bacterium]|nr:hypothetical protein [Acidobacteriota bacterium]
MKQNVVEVYSADGRTRLATLLTVDYATPMSGTTSAVLFPNSTALRAWYFPGDPVGREFVYTQQEAATLYTTVNTPVLWATWDPNDRTTVGRIDVQSSDRTVGQTVGQAAREVADVAKAVGRGVASAAVDVWDDINDNARIVNPTDSRKAAERHLDAAEKVYSDLADRLNDDQEQPLKPVRASIEALEDAFEKNQSWMGHYMAALASLDTLSPDRPVGTSGGTVTLDTATHAALANMRVHLKLFHAQAMK